MESPNIDKFTYSLSKNGAQPKANFFQKVISGKACNRRLFEFKRPSNKHQGSPSYSKTNGSKNNMARRYAYKKLDSGVTRDIFKGKTQEKHRVDRIVVRERPKSMVNIKQAQGSEKGIFDRFNRSFENLKNEFSSKQAGVIRQGEDDPYMINPNSTRIPDSSTDNSAISSFLHTAKKRAEIRSRLRLKNKQFENQGNRATPISHKIDFSSNKQPNFNSARGPSSKDHFINQITKGQFSFFEEFRTPIKGRLPKKSRHRTSDLSLTKDYSRGNNTPRSGRRDSVLSRGFQPKTFRDIGQLQKELEEVTQLSKNQEIKNMILFRLKEELRCPSNQPEIKQYISSVPHLLQQLKNRARDLVDRINQANSRIKEKELQIELMDRENNYKSKHFKLLTDKENEFMAVQDNQRDINMKINRLKKIRVQQSLKINEELHSHTLNFEKQCREQINLVAMEMALTKTYYSDLEIDRFKEKIHVLKSCINRKRGFLGYSS